MPDVLERPGRARIEGSVVRDYTVKARAIDEESRVVELSFSSEERVERVPMFGEPWIEILGHNASEVDLARLNNGAPFLIDHRNSVRDQIGIIERAEIRNGRGVARVRISSDPDSENIFRKMLDGIATKISTSYRVREMVLAKTGGDGPDEFRVTDWEPFEISLVAIPADDTVGINRSGDGASGPYRIIDMEGEMPQPKPKNTGTAPPENETTRELAELRRREAIRELFEGPAAGALRFVSEERRAKLQRELINNPNMTVEAARERLLAAIGEGCEPAGSDPEMRDFNYGTAGRTSDRSLDNPNTFDRVIADALAAKCTPSLDVTGTAAAMYRGLTLTDIAREWLARRGEDVRGMSGPACMRKIFARTFTTSDFANVLADALNKSLGAVYEGIDSPILQMSRGLSTPDFRTRTVARLGTTPDLSQIVEGAEFSYGGLIDEGENIGIFTYGRLFKITRPALVNDDLGVFMDLPRRMALAARRLEAAIMSALLVTNPTLLTDGTAVFHANHDNLNNPSGAAALSETTLTAMRAAMRTQPIPDGGQAGGVLGLGPRFLLVPAALETAGQKLVASIQPALSDDVNPFAGELQLVVDANLDGDSTTAYYTIADPNLADGLAHTYLDGQEQPEVRSEEPINEDAMIFRVRFDFGAAFIDFRGLQKQDGA